MKQSRSNVHNSDPLPIERAAAVRHSIAPPPLPDPGRRALLAGAITVIGASAATSLFPAPAIAGKSGDIRRLYMIQDKTGEMINVVYWANNTYFPDVLSEINFFMRDWREDKIHRMDLRNINTLAAIQAMMRTDRPLQLLSGYRTRSTNNMLRNRSVNVAKKSLHIQGMAADIRIRGVSSSTLAKAAKSCRSGGVGQYTSAGFVHVDCGKLRSWRG